MAITVGSTGGTKPRRTRRARRGTLRDLFSLRGRPPCWQLPARTCILRLPTAPPPSCAFQAKPTRASPPATPCHQATPSCPSCSSWFCPLPGRVQPWLLHPRRCQPQKHRMGDPHRATRCPSSPWHSTRRGSQVQCGADDLGHGHNRRLVPRAEAQRGGERGHESGRRVPLDTRGEA